MRKFQETAGFRTPPSTSGALLFSVYGQPLAWCRHIHARARASVIIKAPEPGHPAIDLPPVGRLVPLRDECEEGGVVRKQEDPDRLTGGAQLLVKRSGERTQP